jgi:hypothetical protein
MRRLAEQQQQLQLQSFTSAASSGHTSSNSQPVATALPFAFIRLTFNPTAAWVDAPQGPEQRGRNSGQPTTAQHPNEPHNNLSAADRAFLKHLNVAAGTEKRRPGFNKKHFDKKQNNNNKKSDYRSNEKGDASGGVGAATSAVRTTPIRHKKAAGPNPLSNRKKRVRETLVVGGDEPPPVPVKKSRTEEKSQR